MFFVSSLSLILLLLQKGLVFFGPTSIHDSHYHALYFTFDYCASFCFETWSEGILLHILCDLPTVYKIVCVQNFIHPFENVRNFVRNCPKSIKISSENCCPKIKCPKIKRPKILEINVRTTGFRFICPRKKIVVKYLIAEGDFALAFVISCERNMSETILSFYHTRRFSG